MERKPIFMIISILVFFSLTISVTGQTPNKTGQDVKNECRFSSKEIDNAAFQLTYVEAVKHSMATAGKIYSSIIIQLANYDRGDRSYHPNPKEEGQRRVTISFSAPTGKKLKAGPYSLNGGMAKDFRLSVGIEKKGKSLGLYNGTGSGEILFIDDKTIKARVKVQDIRGTIIEAAFSTVWEKSRY
jgi:hypothetical protein